MQDLVLSVVKDRRWNDLDVYALSLTRSGFSGRKVMLVQDVPEETQSQLRSHGFEVYQVGVPANLHFQTLRYVPALQFLKDRRGEFRNVIWTDVCDLVFQTDPSPVLDQVRGGFEIVAAKEGWLIKNQEINDIWVKMLVPQSEYHWLREEEVLCSGTIAGTANAMEFLFQTMANRFPGISGMQGIDQGLFNVVSRFSPLKELIRIPEPHEAWVTTAGIFLSPSNPAIWTIQPPNFDVSNGIVSTESGKPFAIQHQYNRHHGLCDPDGAWRGIVERQYR